MKRSYHHSFVLESSPQPNDIKSFQQYATLATHNSLGNLPRSNSYQLEPTLLPSTSLCRISSGIGSIDQIWIQKPPVTENKPSLAGLGIVVESNSPTTSAGPFSHLCQPPLPVSMPFKLSGSPDICPNYGAGYYQLGPHSGSYVASPSDTTMVQTYEGPHNVTLGEDTLEFDDNPYSFCPGLEFIAHSPQHSPFDLSSCTLVYPDSPCLPAPLQASKLDDEPLLDTLYPTCSPLGEPIVGLFADINMRDLATSLRSPSIGINPSCIMGAPSEEDIKEETPNPDFAWYDSVLEEESPSQPQSPAENNDFPEDAISAIVSVLTESLKTDQPAPQSSPSLANPPVRHRQVSGQGLSMPGFPTRSANNSPAMPCSVPRTPQFQMQVVVEPKRLPLAEITQIHSSNVLVPCPTSPVLNAHLGVDLETLRRKAEEFRTKNPGMDIDKNWLQAFAGRLSEEGQLMMDYRCYVAGCSQTNKRRDHILVHVGSHIEFRPFQCDFCGMRFLRKNECKRHSSSHGGQKPFSCEICVPFQSRSFVRQDLLKRHMKVTHGIHSSKAMKRRKASARANNESDDDGDYHDF